MVNSTLQALVSFSVSLICLYAFALIFQPFELYVEVTPLGIVHLPLALVNGSYNMQSSRTYVSCRILKFMIVTEIYVEDCDFTIIDDTKVSTSNQDTLFYQWEANNDFIITADYYPADYWEWFMLDKYVDSTRTIMGVFSSSYDKRSNFGITDLGYGGWKNIMIKWENNTLTFKYNNTIVSKDVSAHEFPVNLALNVNRANTRFKNFKLKKL